MSTTDPTGPVKAPKACFEEPTHVSAKADYFTDFNNKMKADGHYAGITTKIDAALVTVGKFRDAILEAMTGAKGTAKKRNEVETLMRGEQDELLSAVQVVCNANPVTAISHLESLGLSYRTRKPVTKNDIEIRHGENSGSFILLVRSPKTKFAVIWEFTKTPDVDDSWRTADFSENTRGYIEGLVKGTTYYFRSRFSLENNVKTAWTQIFEITCI